jgi:tetratricopeptide (TPR) repeat protein
MGMDQRLLGCEIRAVLAGFRSDSVNLTGRRSLDNPDVGTLVLRRLANVEGTTISATSLQAPKDAKKAFEKGVEANKKGKYADAQKHLEKAVELYPKYATAWNALGVAHQGQNRAEDARAAYAKALEADPKYISPYVQMAQLAAVERKWQEVAETTSKVVRLNPVDFPEAYLWNSIANLNLQKPAEAEKSAREGLKLEGAKRLPKLEHVMGLALANRGDYAGAAEHIKVYLEKVPQGNDAEQARKHLVEVQQRAAQTPR